MTVRSQGELLDIFLTELQNRRPDITDTTEGSVTDALAGATSFVTSETARLVLDEFAKTFFASANGPDVTGGPDDLEFLAIDHFGETFARPGASKATGVLNFARATITAGDVVIPAGTIATTKRDSSGALRRFATTATGTMTGTSLSLSAEAVEAGWNGNVSAGTVTLLESALTDPTVTVINALPFGGGLNAPDDAEYREYIRSKLTSLKSAVRSAIEAAAKAVVGVETATAATVEIPVIEYDIATGAPKVGAKFFRIPLSYLYIANAQGTASPALLASVREAIKDVQSYGVYIDVRAASPFTIDWTLSVTLNAAGPNYATLAGGDTTLITDAMQAYVNALPIGAGFTKTAVTSAMLALFGPSGTNDIVAASTTIPVADVSVASNVKLISGTIGVA